MSDKTIIQETQLMFWDGINGQLDEIESIEEFKKVVASDFIDPDDGLHPDLDCLAVYVKVCEASIKETGETINTIHGIVPICEITYPETWAFQAIKAMAGIPDPVKWVDEAKTIIDYLKIVEQNLRASHAAYLLKTQEHDIAQCRLVEEIEQSEALQQQLATVTQQRDEAVKALNMLLNPDPQHQSSGCPMCDSGVLRNPLKEHWDDCNWNNAKKTLASLTSIETHQKGE